MLITKGSVFKDIDRARTYRYLNELRTFKYPNIEYVENPQDTTLTANIYLTPKKKYGLGFDVSVSQSNIQKVGLSFTTGVVIRNIFKGAETLQISALGAIGASKDGASAEDGFFDINELGADIKLNIPRLFFPLNTIKSSQNICLLVHKLVQDLRDKQILVWTNKPLIVFLVINGFRRKKSQIRLI